MKIVINNCWGTFSLSDRACDILGIQYGTNGGYENNRTAPELINVVEKLGSKASGRNAKLKIIEIPDGINYKIFDYDGYETVIEEGHYWRYEEGEDEW